MRCEIQIKELVLSMARLPFISKIIDRIFPALLELTS